MLVSELFFFLIYTVLTTRLTAIFPDETAKLASNLVEEITNKSQCDNKRLLQKVILEAKT